MRDVSAQDPDPAGTGAPTPIAAAESGVSLVREDNCSITVMVATVTCQKKTVKYHLFAPLDPRPSLGGLT